jgi:hypothetical protein
VSLQTNPGSENRVKNIGALGSGPSKCGCSARRLVTPRSPVVLEGNTHVQVEGIRECCTPQTSIRCIRTVSKPHLFQPLKITAERKQIPHVARGTRNQNEGM